MSRIFMIFSTVISDISMVPFSDIKLILLKPTTMGAILTYNYGSIHFISSILIWNILG